MNELDHVTPALLLLHLMHHRIIHVQRRQSGLKAGRLWVRV